MGRFFLAALLLSTPPALAQAPSLDAGIREEIAKCKALPAQGEQVECLAQRFGYPQPGSPLSAELGELAEKVREQTVAVAGRRRGGYLVDDWWLNEKRNIASTQLTSHKPMYAIVRWTDDVNVQPRGVAAPRDFDDAEVKMQLSFRSELVSPEQFQDLLSDRLRLWLAFTLQANWQAFNRGTSRPFRETNYEPEAILTLDTRAEDEGEAPVGLRPALVNLGIVHQSNGQSEPESRTWWRAYVQGGWQLPFGSLLARTWYTFRDEGVRMDNPDINDYIGRVEVVLRTRRVSLLARNNLRFGPNRGFYQLDWKTPWEPLNLPFHVQISTGYGESLLDYDHRQTTIGFGFSFWDW